MDNNEEYEDILIAFGKKVKILREEKGMSQFDLAYSSNIDRSQIQRIEYGKVNIRLVTILFLSKGLDVSPFILIDGLMDKI